MKISVNNQDLFELTDLQKQVICNDLDADIIELDLKRRLKYILMHKYERCMGRLRKEWEVKLKDKGIRSLPVDDQEFAQLVFSQEDYKDRKAREIDNPDRAAIIEAATKQINAILAQ